MKHIKHFGLGFGKETTLPPANLLVTSRNAIEQIAQQDDFKACLFVEFYFLGEVKNLTGKFNNVEELTFAPVTAHLWRCEQDFVDLMIQPNPNAYSIHAEYKLAGVPVFQQEDLAGELLFDWEVLDREGIKEGKHL